MDGVFTGWRRKCGIAAQAISLVFTGAWIKSAVDDVTHPTYSPDAPALSGNIVVSGYSIADEGSPLVPQVQWTIRGLYSDANITFASDEQNPKWTAPASIANTEIDATNNFGPNGQPEELPTFFGPGPTLNLSSKAPTAGMSNPSEFTPDLMLPVQQGPFQIDKQAIDPSNPQARDEGVTPANHLVLDEVSSEFVQQTSGNQPRMGISFEHDLPIEDGGYEEMEDEPGTVKSQSRFCGFSIERSDSPSGSWSSMMIIPHWSVVIPFGLLSAALHFGSRKKNVPATAPAANPVRVDSDKLLVSFFYGWHPKLGAVMLLMALAFAAGWVRSFIVSDLLTFAIQTDTRMMLASCNDGLVVKQDLIPGAGGSGLFYRSKTGQAHDRMSFRPRHDMELFAVPDTLPTDAASNPAEPMTFGSVTLPGQPVEPGTALPIISVPVSQTIGMISYVGTDFDWCGFYVGYGPSMKTLVIPYGFLVIPLTLVSASLLLRRRVHQPPA